VLVPAYHCGSDVEPLVDAGLECRFYEATDSLEPDAAELEGLLDDRVRALYLIDYLGFPQDAARWRTWCDQRRLLLIEDAAPAWLASRDGVPAGSLADLAIHSLTKQVAVPDGGVGIVNGSHGGRLRGARRADGTGIGGILDRHLAWAVSRSETLSWLRRQAVRRRGRPPFDAMAEMAIGPISRPSRLTAFLAARLAEGVAEGRRRNYRLLLAALDERVPPPFHRLPDGASPMAFPVATERKAELLAHLRRHEIEAIDVWIAPHPSLPVERFPATRLRRETTVGLPVHQELRADDIARIADVTHAWFTANQVRP